MKKQFKLTSQHIELAKNLNISWLADAYYGAPCVDTKRPYSDSAQLMSIALILGMRNDTQDIADEKLTKAQRDKCLAIHKEMQTALEIILHAQTFEPGLYETENHSQRWVRVNNKK